MISLTFLSEKKNISGRKPRLSSLIHYMIISGEAESELRLRL